MPSSTILAAISSCRQSGSELFCLVTLSITSKLISSSVEFDILPSEIFKPHKPQSMSTHKVSTEADKNIKTLVLMRPDRCCRLGAQTCSGNQSSDSEVRLLWRRERKRRTPNSGLEKIEGYLTFYFTLGKRETLLDMFKSRKVVHTCDFWNPFKWIKRGSGSILFFMRDAYLRTHWKALWIVKFNFSE